MQRPLLQPCPRRGRRPLVIGIGLWLVTLLLGCSPAPYPAGLDPTADCPAPPTPLKSRLILIGDAGYPELPLMELLAGWAARLPTRTTVIFLGDNIYPHGFRPKDSAAASQRLARQIEAVRKSGASALFIPGNHDWGKPVSLEVLGRQASRVQAELGASAFQPQHGCVGPVLIPGLPNLLILDTQRWFLKVQPDCSRCGGCTPQQALDSLSRLLATLQGPTVLLTHHPLYSYGAHGGTFDWTDHLFPLTNLDSRLWIPLPLIGSLYPVMRRNLVLSGQDLHGRIYCRLRRELLLTFTTRYRGSLPLIVASGHDHSLQLIHNPDCRLWQIVSGAGSGSSLTQVRRDKGTVFAHRQQGFFVLDYYDNGAVLAQVVELGSDTPVFCKRIVAGTASDAGSRMAE